MRIGVAVGGHMTAHAMAPFRSMSPCAAAQGDNFILARASADGPHSEHLPDPYGSRGSCSYTTH